MPKIKKLDPQEIIKIAAGEVIERPANVIKELLENAIDAQATQISLFVEDGGKKLIQIIDNGTGMSREDAILSIEHHATSKLNSVHDLDKILTFGFRGEALSSITSISKVRLISKEAEDLTATELEILGGEIIEIKTVSSNTGTTLLIEDLFFNVPVRKKFLKSKETEFRTIVHLFYVFCLSNLSISFKLHSDKKLIYHCPPVKTLRERLDQIYDQDLTNNSIIVDEIDSDNKLQLKGIITKPSYNRYDRNQIFIFVNNRWVKNYKLTQALTKSYQGSLQPDKYPAGFLFLTIDPKEIDINIHPKKEEVHFLHPRIVENFITKSIKNCLDNSIKQSLHPQEQQEMHSQNDLSKNINTVPNINNENFSILSKPNIKFISLKDIPESPSNAVNETFSTILNNYFDSSKQIITSHEQTSDNKIKEQNFINDTDNKASLNSTHELNKQTEPTLKIFNQIQNSKYKIIGQLFDTYIMIENDNELVLVDQHASHERVLYEKIKCNNEPIQPINLLINQILTLSSNNLIMLEPFLPLLHDQGIIAESFGKDKLIIKALPHYLKNKSIDDIIKQTIALIEHSSNIQQLKLHIQDDLQKQISCKAAVKSGDKLTQESMFSIIRELYNTANKLTCPHGRPTIWPINKNEIEKKFKRDYKGKFQSSIFDID